MSTEFKLDPVVKEAHERFTRCEEHESTFRKLFLEDVKFANADPDNGYQWPNDVRKMRQDMQQPCLTVNKTRQHCLSIVNDMRENKPGIKFRATGNGATYRAAQGMNALARRIEAQSNADAAYTTAATFMVQGGYGVVIVETDYADGQSFDQEIFIRGVPDPLKVYLDPNAKEPDKSDAKYGFVFDEMDEEAFEEKYPKYAKLAHKELGFGPKSDWYTKGDKKRIRVCDYYRVEYEEDQLLLVDPAKPPVLRSTLGDDIADQLLAERPDILVRDTVRELVMWYFIAGSTVCEKRLWPSKYVPIVPFIAEEIVIDGKLERKGHTRSMKDPQRIYNYWTSTAVEYGALQSKTPYIAPLEAIEGHEALWNSANTTNHAYLPYNHMDEQGQPVPPPTRQQPPMAAPVALQGMATAQQELELVSGQFAAQMGQPGNERTGAALNARQRQGDRATFHYLDGMSAAVTQVGRIIQDLIPKIYDTKRVFQVLSEDGTDFMMTVDPSAPQAAEVHMNDLQQVTEMILNPSVGSYTVVADSGPGYATKRAEAFDAFTLFLTQAPALTTLIGDLMLRSGDFPMAEEAAERLRRMVPPQALGVGPTQNEQQLMGQLQQSQTMITTLMNEVEEARLKLRGRAEARDIDAFRAETDRLKLFMDRVEKDFRLWADTVQDAHAIDLKRIHQANASEIEGLMGKDEAAAAQGQPTQDVTAGAGAQAPAQGSFQF